MADLPESLDLGRTVPVWRGDQIRFHIVLRAGLGIIAVSGKKKDSEPASASLAHEAAHVEHETNLHRLFPQFRRPPTRSNAATVHAPPLSRYSTLGANTPPAAPL